ncbi:glycerophosphodiester phosphodiesterase [Pseudarthrobacter sp. NamE2]|uniref:glycerophosphodiester phosphodiesterase n=1 Tax=Pseudarthrobacter sp. NamE2 TaxID=2576838 RepID=UPI00197AAC6D|nr:glycerophosphodiester phosphodiesterase [Pseudarthrobacter sp. NamE2]
MTSNQVLSFPQEQVAAGPFRDPKPWVFTITGHRGAMALAPENSALSFDLAARTADEVELDVRVTADGVPIVLHDPTLERLAAGPHPLADKPARELPLAELQAVPLASGQPVLTLAEALDAIGVPVQAEIKDPAAVPAVATLVNSHPGPLPCIRFSSFLPEALTQLQRSLPHVPRGLILAEFPATPTGQEGVTATLAATGATTLYCGFRNLTALQVDRLHRAGIDVHVWPLACFDDVCLALDLAADWGTADDPGRARGWLDSVGGGMWRIPAQLSGMGLAPEKSRVPQDCSG